MNHSVSFRGSRVRWAGLAALAVALVLGAYANSLDNAFHFDDSHVILDNAHLREPVGFLGYFTDARWFSALPQNATYRPLLSLTLAFDAWRSGGLDPRPFHVTQLVLLVLLGAALWAFFTRLFHAAESAVDPQLLGLWAATFFCVHTGNSQVGNYISSRSEIISALGVVGAFLVYLRWPHLRRTGLFLLPMVLGALAKTPAVMFAPMLLAYRVLVEEGLRKTELFSRRALRAALATVPAFLVAGVTVVGVEKMNPPGQTYGGAGRLEYLWTQSWVLVRYVRLFFWPSGLSADTDLSVLPSPVDFRVAAGVLLLGALLVLAWKATEGVAGRVMAFGIVWFLLGLFPTSVTPLAEVTNDHRMFLGYIGLTAAAVLFAGQAWGEWVRPGPRRYAALAACFAILLSHAAATRARNEVWKTDESLWADTVEKSPRNGRALMNYGRTQMSAGRLQDAKALFLRARELTPNYSILEVNLAVVSAALGDHAAAEQYYERAVWLDPQGVAPLRFYADWLISRGRADEASPLINRAVVASPSDLPALQLQTVLAALASPGDQPSATAAAQLYGLRPATDNAVGWHTLGFQLTSAQSFRAAAVALTRAVQLEPENAAAWNDLGWALGNLGLRGAAKRAFERAQGLKPDDARIGNNAAWLVQRERERGLEKITRLQSGGRLAEALAIAADLVVLSPRDPQLLREYARLLEQSGRLDDAQANRALAEQLERAQAP